MFNLVTDDCQDLSIYWLKKYKYLKGYKSGRIEWSSGHGNKNSVGMSVDVMGENPYMILNYIHTDKFTNEKNHYNYKILLTTSPCHYGGKRYWFICPLVTNGRLCMRRVGVLYHGGNYGYFGCRHCLDIGYSSKNENRRGGSYYVIEYFRLLKKFEKLEKEIKIRFRKGKPTKKLSKYAIIYMKLHKFQNIR